MSSLEAITEEPIFLIAVPQLGDPNFAKSVVLILHQSEEGALGLVLNNTIGLDLGTFSKTQDFECHSRLEDFPVFRGGPVEPDRGWILHNDADIQERQEILPGVFVSGTTESLRHLLESGSPFRLLLGYAGWGPGQLEEELAEGAWLTVEADPKHVLQTDPSETWDMVLDDLGVDPTRLAEASGIH